MKAGRAEARHNNDRTDDTTNREDSSAHLDRGLAERPDRLLQPYAQQAISEPPHRVVCDYIAGMTDTFFYRTYHQMIGPDTVL